MSGASGSGKPELGPRLRSHMRAWPDPASTQLYVVSRSGMSTGGEHWRALARNELSNLDGRATGGGGESGRRNVDPAPAGGGLPLDSLDVCVVRGCVVRVGHIRRHFCARTLDLDLRRHIHRHWPIVGRMDVAPRHDPSLAGHVHARSFDRRVARGAAITFLAWESGGEDAFGGYPPISLSRRSRSRPSPPPAPPGEAAPATTCASI